MGRTGSLARRRSARVAVDAVAVAVILVPLVLAPFGSIRKLLARVLDRPAAGAELLPEFYSPCGAEFDTTSAGNAVGGLDPGDVCAAGHIRGVEELGSAQSIADLDVAVADCEYLSLAVNVGYLVDVAVVLGSFELLHRR